MDTMLSKALREFTTGPLNQLIVNLGGQDGNQWEEQLKKFLRKEPCWTNGQVAQTAEPEPTLTEPPKLEFLLDPVGTVTVAATTSKFVARDRFVVNTRRDIAVKISAIGGNFTAWFLSGDGKTEDPIMEQTMRYAKLRKAATDMPQKPGEVAIIPELGGEAKAETTLSEIFSLMEKQGKGEDGVLLNNGWANIFYIRDQSDVLRAVGVRWYDDGWRLFARSVEDPRGWSDGRQVFSRNSVLKPSEPLAPAQA